MRKRREEDRAVWQREREEMQRQVNMCWEEDRAVWQREREEFQGASKHMHRQAATRGPSIIQCQGTRATRSAKSRKGQGVAGGDAQEKRGGEGSMAEREGRDSAASKQAAQIIARGSPLKRATG